MSRRVNVYCIGFISGLFVLLLLASNRFTGNINYRNNPDFRRTIQSFPFDNTINNNNLINTNNNNNNDLQQQYYQQQNSLGGSRNNRISIIQQKNVANNENYTIDDIISIQRNNIEVEMYNYNYPNGENDVRASKLTDLTMETGGNPLRSIVITTWRSGSTFLGDILNAIPGNFYHYEPLLNFDIMQIRGPPFAKLALRNLKKLLDCDFSNMDDYLSYGMEHTYLFTHNSRLWDQCLEFPSVCWNSTFLSKFCKLFPFQSMKVVRLRLKLAEELLGTDSSGPRMLLLVRDPRGTMQSRRHRVWCPHRPDCDQPSLLCADLVADYAAAVRMAAVHPKRFRVLRYEDLSLDPYNTVSSLLKFLGLDFHPNVREFLDTHTKLDAGGFSSTFRNSKSAPFHWTKDLDFKDVWAIQNECTEAMAHWGYNKAHNRSHLLSKDFNSLGKYSLA